MDCKDCAESVDGAPGGSCCGQCLEDSNPLEAICGQYLEEPIIEVEPPGPRRALVRAEKVAEAFTAVLEELAEARATILAYRLELSGALSLLKDRDAMCAKLAEALRVALRAMKVRRLMLDDVTINCLKELGDEEATIEAVLKEWEDGK